MRRMVKKAVRNAGKGIANEGINFENLYSIIIFFIKKTQSLSVETFTLKRT